MRASTPQQAGPAAAYIPAACPATPARGRAADCQAGPSPVTTAPGDRRSVGARAVTRVAASTASAADVPAPGPCGGRCGRARSGPGSGRGRPGRPWRRSTGAPVPPLGHSTQAQHPGSAPLVRPRRARLPAGVRGGRRPGQFVARRSAGAVRGRRRGVGRRAPSGRGGVPGAPDHLDRVRRLVAGRPAAAVRARRAGGAPGAAAELVEPLVLRWGREADQDVPRRTGPAEHRDAEVGALLVLDGGDVPDAVRGVVQPGARPGGTATGEWPPSIPESTE